MWIALKKWWLLVIDVQITAVLKQSLQKAAQMSTIIIIIERLEFVIIS